MKFHPNTNTLLWFVYLALLGVLLPHTAWLFAQFEPISNLGRGAAWAGAFAFEAAIAVLTHKLAKHIEATPKRLSGSRKFTYRYLNAFSIGLIISVAVSALANLAHAVEFGRGLAIFAAWGIPAKIYQLSFGAVLPIVSLLFARVLSNVTESEDAPNPELEQARSTLAEVRRELRESEAARMRAEERFGAAGDLFAALFAEGKRERILAAKSQWPALPAAAIAVIAATSASYVSEVLKDEKVTQ